MRKIEKNGYVLLTGSTVEMLNHKNKLKMYNEYLVDENTFEKYKNFWNVDEEVY